MRKLLTLLCPLFCLLMAQPVMAQESPSVLDEEEQYQPIAISLSQADRLIGEDDVYFYDVNTPDIYDLVGHLPDAIYINQSDWYGLLPEDKEGTVLVFYCANRICYASVDAAIEAKKLGYKNVYNMPEGIYGWVTSGRPAIKD